MADKGLSEFWTPTLEAKFNLYLNGPNMRGPNSFPARHVILSLRDALKYDSQTREGQRAQDAARLRIATATDDELREIAEIEHFIKDDGSIEQNLLELKESQAQTWLQRR
ncbi:unnamed protein product [marine sediment metagenome]|uniref:Uncharacterized protein n=1 Tax=marine sediment metagenome TaxID=412755 RepID=X1Q0E2_9ZZZZ